MGRVIITKKELDFCKSNKVFLNQAFIASVRAQDVTTLELLFKSTNLKSCLDIKQEDLFSELIVLVIDDKNAGILKLIVDELKLQVELKQQKIPETQETLLDIAAWYGVKDIVTFLLIVGLDPNNKDNNGQTPLHKAVMANSEYIISLLISRGAVVNIQDRTDGNTPLHLAIFHKDYLILTALQNAGAKQNIANKRGYNYLELYKALTKGSAKVTMPNLQPPEEQENSKFYAGMTSFYKGILSDINQVEFFARAINSIKTFLDELSIFSGTKDFAYEGLWALAKSYEYYKYKDSKDNNKLQKYIIDKAKAWGDILQFESDLPYPLAELLKNWDSAHLASFPKDPECSASTQELDLILAMSLQKDAMKVLGVSDNDEPDV